MKAAEELPIITILDQQMYHWLVTMEMDFFTKPYSSKIKSIFCSNTPPNRIKIRNGYHNTAKYFIAEVKKHFPSIHKDYYFIEIGTPQIPPKKQDFNKVAHVIAKGLGLTKADYNLTTEKLESDNELLLRKVADLTNKKTVHINKKWNLKPFENFKFYLLK